MARKKSGFLRSILTFCSLRQTAGQIMLSSLIIVIVCVAFLSVTFYVPTSNQVKSYSTKQLVLDTKLLAKEMDIKMKEQQTVVRMIAEQGASIEDNKEQQMQFLSSLKEQHPEFTTVLYSPDVTGQFAMDATGKEYDLSSRPYVKEIQAGRSYVSEPLISVVDNTLGVAIGAPVMKDGQPVGFYTAGYRINELVEDVSAFKHGNTGQAVLMTASGIFIYSPDETKIMNSNITDMGNTHMNEAFAEAVKGNYVAFDFQIDGVKRLGYMTQTELNWVVVTYMDESEFSKPVNDLLLLILTVGIIIVAAALLLSILIATKIVKPIRQLTHGIDLLAQGDLTYRIPVKGKTDISAALHSFNRSSEQLHQLMTNVSDLSGQLTDSAKQLAVGAEQGSNASQSITEAIMVVAEGSERQTSSVQDGSDVAENIAMQINGVAEHSSHVSTVASEANVLATDGSTAMHDLGRKMDEMEYGIRELSGTIQNLSSLSTSIGEVVGVISNIARQTNILSLNAAIEASRSGEAGRGFAVVADEVRNLAGQSIASAEQIAGFIGRIQVEIERTLRASEQTVEQAAQGKQAGEVASELFTNIRSSVEQVADSIRSVTAAAEEIVSGTGSLVGSIRLIADSASETAAETENVSAAAQQQMASMEEVASSSAELANMSEQLRSQIEKFKL
ncbi:methyl-accepting chemotaxis protein [Paenibacillus amylolyticus]|uniref:Methyl-accepting chemotaxis protein n=1 Tax=Paenibacillus amylolyticus TaxID=1451 RepID=A0A5M9WRQ4_PAEAM|nr:methyl-accepting chemotaxis protein [Paenibacillus amylolyticus]KAA8784203.1 methyl-accepting chemotaxis protein [Paenibacillus amylolyticus]